MVAEARFERGREEAGDGGRRGRGQRREAGASGSRGAVGREGPWFVFSAVWLRSAGVEVVGG